MQNLPDGSTEGGKKLPDVAKKSDELSPNANEKNLVVHAEEASFWREIIKWVEVYRDVKDPRGRILKGCSYITTLIIIISAYYSITPTNNNIVKVVAGIFLNIGTSVLAAALVEIAAKMRKQWEQGWTENRFRALFSVDLEPGSVAIVLPKFPIENKSEKAQSDLLIKDIEGIK